MGFCRRLAAACRYDGSNCLSAIKKAWLDKENNQSAYNYGICSCFKLRFPNAQQLNLLCKMVLYACTDAHTCHNPCIWKSSVRLGQGYKMVNGNHPCYDGSYRIYAQNYHRYYKRCRNRWMVNRHCGRHTKILDIRTHCSCLHFRICAYI